jgi:hypothetical protein
MSDAANISLSGSRSTSVPELYRNHPVLRQAPFFTLPRELLDRVVGAVGSDRFDAELLAMEYALSNICRDHSAQIGFWRNGPIDYILLRRVRSEIDEKSEQYYEEWADHSGVSVDDLKRALQSGISRLEHFATVGRGYLGWLITNRSFLAEHAAIFGQWVDEIAEQGVPQMGPVIRNARTLPYLAAADEATADFLTAFEDFFIRWRLEGMSVPMAPRPVSPHLPVRDLRTVLGHMQYSGTTFYYPDTFPVPSRDELRNIMEEALRHSPGPEHLAAWLDIVRSDNASRNQIPRFARIFEVQHYVRALYGRHAKALDRKKSVVDAALGRFLGVSEDTIKGDLVFIASRLQRDDWYLSPT